MNFSQWKAGTAFVIALGMTSATIVPFSIPVPVSAAPAPTTLAQLFPRPGTTPSRKVAIPAGTRLPVQYNSAEKVVVLPTETVPLTLTIAKNIRSSEGNMLIPAGTQVQGYLKPAEGGSQFTADTLIFADGTKLPLNASSKVVTTTQEIQPGVDTSSVLKGAAIGAGAATVISAAAGNHKVTLGKIVLGAGAGAVGGLIFGKRRADVVVIHPNTDLELTLNSSLVVALR